MKNILKSITLIIIGLGMYSCGDDDPGQSQNDDGSVEMALKVTYGGNPLILSQDYSYPDGKAMYFSRFSFYMSDLTLSSEGAVATSNAINYLRLGQAQTTAAGAAEGYKYMLNGVKSGNYSNINFNIGVPADQNAMKPEDFVSSNDLSLSGEYWPGWSSYVFCKVEGVIDFDDDGTPETDFALHLGADEALVNIDLDRDFIVNDDETTELIIPIELKNMFENGSTIFDIEANPKIHTLSQAGAIAELAENLKTCF